MPVLLVLSLVVLIGGIVCARVAMRMFTTRDLQAKYLLPGLLALLTAYSVLLPCLSVMWRIVQGRMSESEARTLTDGAALMILFTISWMAGFFGFPKRGWAREQEDESYRQSRILLESRSINRSFVIFSLVLALCWIATLRLLPSSYNSDQEAHLGMLRTDEVAVNPYVAYAVSYPTMLFVPAVAIMWASAFFHRRKIVLIVGSVMLLAIVAVGAAGGTRTAVVAPLVTVAIMIYLFGRRKIFLFGLIGIVIFTGFYSTVALVYRTSETARSKSIAERITAVLDVTRRVTFEGAGPADDQARKKRGPNVEKLVNGGTLYEYASDHDAYSYFRPYYGVVTCWIPRAIWTGKPVPLSGDGTYHGIPAYLLAEIKAGSQRAAGALTLTAPAGAVMYWQFGYAGVVLGGIFGGWLTRILNKIAFRNGFIGVTLLLWVFNPGVGPAQNLDRLFLTLLQQAIPLLICVWLDTLLFGADLRGRLPQAEPQHPFGYPPEPVDDFGHSHAGGFY